MALSDFADKHGLVMQVKERTRTELWRGFDYESNRYYAQFRDVDVKDGAVLRGTFGNGRTPEAAMANYAKEISGKLLVKDWHKPDERKEFHAPELTT